jgi:hypothetical protein
MGGATAFGQTTRSLSFRADPFDPTLQPSQKARNLVARRVSPCVANSPRRAERDSSSRRRNAAPRNDNQSAVPFIILMTMGVRLRSEMAARPNPRCNPLATRGRSECLSGLRPEPRRKEPCRFPPDLPPHDLVPPAGSAETLGPNFTACERADEEIRRVLRATGVPQGSLPHWRAAQSAPDQANLGENPTMRKGSGATCAQNRRTRGRLVGRVERHKGPARSVPRRSLCLAL